MKKYSPFDIVLQYNKLLENTLECQMNDKIEDEWDKILEANARHIFKNSTCVLDTDRVYVPAKNSKFFY